MGFSVSTLSNYTNQESTNLIKAVQFQSETAALIGLQSGIKSAADVHLLSVAPVPQAGGSCGFNASGSTSFTARTLTTYAIKYQEQFCMNDLEAKWTQLLLKKGQNYTEADLPAEIMAEVVKVVNARNETADWQGDTASVNAYINRYDGLLKIIDAATGVVSATASTYNETNCRTILRDMVSKVPDALKGNPDFTFFIGYPEYTTYLNKISADNHFHMFDTSKYGEIRLENSPYKLKAVHGLDNTSRIIGAMPENLILGCDMENEQEEVKLWYSQDDDLVKYSIKFRRGLQIAIASEIVEYTNA